jgi:hypothetical protein
MRMLKQALAQTLHPTPYTLTPKPQTLHPTPQSGANDIPMLKLAGLGVAFHAKPKVKQQAKVHPQP